MATSEYDIPDLKAKRKLVFEGVSDNVVVVTPTNGLAVGPFRALRSEGGGNVTVHCCGAAAGAYVALRFTAGETRAVAVDEVRATGTTATGQLEGIY